jgi:thiol-disulfide isomerase/thioredoxin
LKDCYASPELAAPTDCHRRLHGRRRWRRRRLQGWPGLQHRQRPRPDTGKKVEVLEFFMYHCPHCNALDPVLADWVKKNSDKIVFKRMHMGDDAQAKAFYTLEAMNITNLHEKLFHAIHVERNRLNTDAGCWTSW